MQVRRAIEHACPHSLFTSSWLHYRLKSKKVEFKSHTGARVSVRQCEVVQQMGEYLGRSQLASHGSMGRRVEFPSDSICRSTKRRSVRRDGSMQCSRSTEAVDYFPI